MGELPTDVRIEYAYVKVLIKKCTSEAPECWYKDLIGRTIEVRRKNWFREGKPDGFSYEMPRPPGGGFNGHLMNADIEEIK